MGAEGMSRRQALTLAGAGLLGAGVGVTGLVRWRGAPGRDSVTAGAGLVEPDVLASEGGRLHVRLTAGPGPVELAGRRVEALSYNGSVPGPTWWVRPGDRVTVDLVNLLGEPTNLHVHGLHVSPEGNGDNAFVHVAAGETFRYEYELPASHPAGTFWYHPHLHGRVADQVFGGLAGAIVVAAEDDQLLAAAGDRVLVVSDVTLDGARVARVGPMEQMMGREGQLVLVNGQRQPTVSVRPGAWERWRVVNACTSRYLRLRLDGAEVLQVGRDGGPVAEPLAVERVVLVPGNRADLLVRVSEPGAYRLVAEPVDRGSTGMGGMMGGRTAGGEETIPLLRVDVRGDAVATPEPPTRLADLDDLRGLAVQDRRTLTFAMGMGMGMGGPMAFTIDGREFDGHRVDTRVGYGTVEEWRIGNDSPMDHPLHLHVWPMQVVARGGRPVDGPPEWLDVVNVPARDDVTVRVRFADFAGRSVYHCHILDHEDLGMMGVVEAGR